MYEAFGEKFPIQLKVDKYSITGNLAIEMVNWKHRYPSSWAALTVDLNEVCEKDCSYVDTNPSWKKNIVMDYRKWIRGTDRTKK